MNKTSRILVRASIALLSLALALVVGRYLWNSSSTKAGESITDAHGNGMFAQRFTVEPVPGARLLTITNPWKGDGTVFRWLLLDSSTRCKDCVLPDSLLSLPRLQLPLRRIVVLSTTQIGLLARLNALDVIVGVGKKTHISNPILRQRIDSLGIPSVGHGATLDLERTLQLAPDAVLTFGTGSSEFDDWHRLMSARIPTIITAEWMENHPLGRFEWIRLMGLLLHKQKAADSIFVHGAVQYDSLRRMAAEPTKKMGSNSRLKVIIGYAEGDSWNTSGGQSYMAHFVHDAGAEFVDRQDSQTGIRRIAFESMLHQGIEADVWLNPGAVATRQELHLAEPRTSLFSAWKSGRIYQHNRVLNAEGSTDFYESSIAYPEIVLADLMHVLHPQLLPNHTPRWYQQLP